MKKFFLFLVALFSFAFAQIQGMPAMQKGMKMDNFRAVPFKEAQILQDGNAKMFCPKCGMTLPMFYRTNHVAKIDGKMQQFCSIHCLVDAMNSGAKVSDIQVVDNSTLKFIPVSKAWYAVGSNKPATMSKVSKYAFGTKEAAQNFAKENGGKVMQFDALLAMAKKAFAKEQKMIGMKQHKMAQMGAKIYQAKCKPMSEKFKSIAHAKAYIQANNICRDLKGKSLQAVALYLLGR